MGGTAEPEFNALAYHQEMLTASHRGDFDISKELAAELLAYLDSGGNWPGKIRRALVRAECKVILNSKLPAVVSSH